MMSEWPIYLNPYERRTCLGLFRVTDSSHPVCLIQLKTHLSSSFTVAGLAIPGKEIDDAPGILEALHALGSHRPCGRLLGTDGVASRLEHARFTFAVYATAALRSELKNEPITTHYGFFW